MDIKQLKEILLRLTELEKDWFLAKNTKDNRKKEKRISHARNAIASYARCLPGEVIVFLEKNVGTNALHYQRVGDDISRSVKAIEGWIRVLSNSEMNNEKTLKYIRDS